LLPCWQATLVFPEQPLVLPAGVPNSPVDYGIPTTQNLEGAIPCDGRGEFEICWDTMAIGSGLNLLGCTNSSCTFVGITDRGPNADCGDLGKDFAGKSFPVQGFSPVVTVFTTGPSGLQIVSQDHLKVSSAGSIDSR
jgi:hypothetical protein